MSDSTTHLDQIDRTATASDVAANELFDAASPATAYGRRASTSAGLTWGYYGCRYGGTLVANGTLTLTASSTCYIVANRTTGAVSFSTSSTNWDDASTYARLYKVVTGATAVTNYEDHRMGPGGLVGSGVASALADGDYGDIEVSGGGSVFSIDSDVLSAYGRTLIDAADAVAARATLALGSAALLASDTDSTLAANSDTRTATQKAVKSYVDSVVSGGAVDVMVFKGVIDCSANPNYPAADAGHLYKVSVAGKIGGGSGPNVEAGDTLYCITDSTGAGTHASVGANWVIAQVNVDGAVTGPASATDGYVAVFDGTTGKILKVRSFSQLAGDLQADLKPTEWIPIACSDESTALTTGTAKVTFRMPYAFTVTAVRASLTTAQASGSIFTVDINESGASIISTKLTIDNTERTSTTAATAAVISDASLADDAEITIDIDQIGDGTAKGLKVYLIGRRT